MAFERISRMFKSGMKAKESAGEPAAEPAEAQHLAPRTGGDDQRLELLSTLDHGFGQVAGVLHRLDHHLQANTELLSTMQQTNAELPLLLQAQQKLVQMVASAERGNQAVLQSLTANLKQRDDVQQAAMRQLGLLTQASHDQRNHYQEQLQLVLRLQRGGRGLMFVLVLISLSVAALFLFLFMAVAMRPDLFPFLHQLRTTTAEQPSTVPAPTAPAELKQSG
jgi:hypothetical protein